MAVGSSNHVYVCNSTGGDIKILCFALLFLYREQRWARGGTEHPCQTACDGPTVARTIQT